MTDAISVGLAFLTSNVGSPEEPPEVRQLRSRGLFMLVAIPPATWIAIGSRVMPNGPEWVLIGPAFVWVALSFLWIVRSYGPSRYSRMLDSTKS